MVETRHDTTKSTHCRDVGALLLKPSHRQGRNDKSYLFLPNYRRKQRGFACVDLRAAMFSFPSCVAIDRIG